MWSGTNPSLTPTAANPIVGRVAFWTDDESAKVNVNTASEGTFWDTIVANSGASVFGNQPIPTSSSSANPIPDYTQPMGDIPLALLQPAQHEYQRYPGAPRDDLSFERARQYVGYVQRANALAVRQGIHRRDAAGHRCGGGMSSMGGTQAPQASDVTDLDRLYASLDEFQFTPTRTVQTLGASSNATTLQNDVDTCRFFLTAHSKAPN